MISGLGLNAKGLTDYEKIAKVSYFVGSFMFDQSGTDSWSDAPIFRTNRCEMGSLLIKNILDKFGIETYYVNNDYHGWLIVKCDGNYYFLDWMVLSSKFLSPVQATSDNEYVDIYYTEYAADGMSSWNAKRTLKWFMENTGKGKCPTTPYPKRTVITNTHTNGTTYDISLEEPKITTTATSAGYVITWDGVKDADFYDVYAFSFDGITNNFTRYEGGVNKNYTDVNDCIYKKTWKAGNFDWTQKRIFSLDKNENGQYQCFISGREDEFGRVFCVVARNVDGRVSRSLDTFAMFKEYATVNYFLSYNVVDKTTGEKVDLPTGAKILEYPTGSYAVSKYIFNHTHNWRQARVVRKATTKNKGAVVYECTECLQRKMVYTPVIVCNHQWETTFTKATLSKNGGIVQTCPICGESKTLSTYYAVNNITLNTTKFAYDGKQKTPTVTVKDSKGNVLKNGTDYTVAMSDTRTEIGSYDVTVTLQGNYQGSKTLKFEIAEIKGWYKENGKWYYYKNNTAVKWRQKIGGKYYYFNGAGVMQTGWIKGGTWMYAASDGALKTGWQKIGGKWYWFTSEGSMVTGWKKISGKWYYFNTSGAMLTGWQKISGKWYYFNSSGAMLTGWQKISGKWYYFNDSGTMRTANLKQNGKTYRFNSNGACTNR